MTRRKGPWNLGPATCLQHYPINTRPGALGGSSGRRGGGGGEKGGGEWREGLGRDEEGCRLMAQRPRGTARESEVF